MSLTYNISQAEAINQSADKYFLQGVIRHAPRYSVCYYYYYYYYYHHHHHHLARYLSFTSLSKIFQTWSTLTRCQGRTTRADSCSYGGCEAMQGNRLKTRL